MADKTLINWADVTWNPVVGCTHISSGCDNCYAERTAARLAKNPQVPWYRDVISDGKWNGNGVLVEHLITKPLGWKKPRRIFVGSMTDLFHERMLNKWLDQLFAVMALCPQHIFMLLTKRPERMKEYIGRFYVAGWKDRLIKATPECVDLGALDALSSPILPNVWLGVTAENQEMADERIPVLLDTLAEVRFVSVEPMLGEVDFSMVTNKDHFDAPVQIWPLHGLHALDWVICGGESGPDARPMHPDWVRSLRDQCAAAGVPFWMKQWGEFLPDSQNPNVQGADNGWQGIRVGKKVAGRLLDGVEHNGMPGLEVRGGY